MECNNLNMLTTYDFNINSSGICNKHYDITHFFRRTDEHTHTQDSGNLMFGENLWLCGKIRSTPWTIQDLGIHALNLTILRTGKSSMKQLLHVPQKKRCNKAKIFKVCCQMCQHLLVVMISTMSCWFQVFVLF